MAEAGMAKSVDATGTYSSKKGKTFPSGKTFLSYWKNGLFSASYADHHIEKKGRKEGFTMAENEKHCGDFLKGFAIGGVLGALAGIGARLI